MKCVWEMSNNNRNTSGHEPDFAIILKELQTRVQILSSVINLKLKRLTRHFCSILLVCDNKYNEHFAENALCLFCFLAFENEALTYGYLPIDGQERLYKGFISKQTGTFNKEVSKGNKRDMTMRLTSCCINNLTNEVSLIVACD